MEGDAVNMMQTEKGGKVESKMKSLLNDVEVDYYLNSIQEKLVQQIWFNQDIQKTRLYTVEGERVEVLKVGFWNKLKGPDFKDAQLRIGNEVVHGDVEIHLYRGDWIKHRHQQDPAYNKVILDVALFDLPNYSTRQGESPKTLILLPYLLKDLEDYLQEYALLALEERDHLGVLLEELSTDLVFRWEQIREKAYMRWRQKYNFAAKRLEKHGWQETCHQLFLEVLGYRQNKAVMARLALENNFIKLSEVDWTAEELVERYKGFWQTHAVRPNNRPNVRLGQYRELMSVSPSWPNALQLYAEALAEKVDDYRYLELNSNINEVRKRMHLRALRDELVEDILGSVLSSTRLDTWVVDGFLPLASVMTGKDFFKYWFYWYSGDVPDTIHVITKDFGMKGECNGMNQAALQMCIEKGFL